MTEQETFNRLNKLYEDIKDISSKLSIDQYKSLNISTEVKNLKSNIAEIQHKIQEIEKNLIEQKTETKNTKKTLMTVGAAISILIAVFTYYSEYLSDRPSPVEQQKNIDSLWAKYNNLIDRLVDEKDIK